MKKYIITFVWSRPKLKKNVLFLYYKFDSLKRNYYDRLRRRKSKKYSLIFPHDLPMFVPVSGGHISAISKLTALSVRQVIPFIELLQKQFGKQEDVKIYSIEEFVSSLSNLDTSKINNLIDKLANSFKSHGSDKATFHNYHLVYAPLIENMNRLKGLLEVGLGSNNTDVISNMGYLGRPGASLRAFRDCLPNVAVYGADFDKRILFEEERIKTFFVDQTKLETFDLLDKSIRTEINFIIDDGLHSPNANIATLIFALNKMKNNSDGTIVIEDISESAIPIWKVVSHIIPKSQYQTYIIKTRSSYMFVCIKKSVKHVV